eukprot:gene1717-2015_t
MAMASPHSRHQSWVFAVNGHSTPLAPSPLSYPDFVRRKSSRWRHVHVDFFSPRFRSVVHLVRCPLRHIAAFTTHLNQSYRFVSAHMLSFPEPHVQLTASSPYLNSLVDYGAQSAHCVRGDGLCLMPFSALSWVYWNRHISSSYADHTWPVENLTAARLALLCRLALCPIRTGAAGREGDSSTCDVPLLNRDECTCVRVYASVSRCVEKAD